VGSELAAIVAPRHHIAPEVGREVRLRIALRFADPAVSSGDGRNRRRRWRWGRAGHPGRAERARGLRGPAAEGEREGLPRCGGPVRFDLVTPPRSAQTQRLSHACRLILSFELMGPVPPPTFTIRKVSQVLPTSRLALTSPFSATTNFPFCARKRTVSPDTRL